MKTKLSLVAKLIGLGLLLCACIFQSVVPTATIAPTDTPTPLMPGTDTPTATTALPTDTPTVALPTEPPTDTDTPWISPTPFLVTVTSTGPAIAHFNSGQKFDPAYIRMADENQGWAIGGLNKASDHVFRTQDGGQIWLDVTPPQPLPGANESLTALGYFLDAQTGWVAYGPADVGVPDYILVWSTHDGGATWSYGAVSSENISGEAFSPYYINFADARHGWLMMYLGAGMMHAYVALFVTSDGGSTWTDILDPYTENNIQSFPKTGMVFVDAQTGWLTRDGEGVDPSPHIFRTADAGVTWTRIDLPAPTGTANFFDAQACGTYSPNAFSAQTVIIAMKCQDTNTFKIEQDYLYSTTDAGATWQMYALPADYILGEGLYFLDSRNGKALGRKIYATTDGGQTWKFVQQVFWDGQFSFLNAELGWAFVKNENGETGLVKTVDGGASWSLLHPVVGP